MSQFAPPRRVHPGVIVATVAVGLWALGVTVAVHIVTWLLEQYVEFEERRWPGWSWPVAGWLTAGLVAMPALVLALGVRAPAIRAVGRVWTMAAVCVGVLSCARAVPLAHNTGYLLLLAVLAAVLAFALRRVPRELPRRYAEYRPAGLPGTDRQALPYAVAAGLVALLPWLVLGALGGLLETLAAAAAALAVGRLAATLLDRDFWSHFAGSAPRLVLLGGLAAAVPLALLAAGAGASGVHIAQLVALPPLGFAAAVLNRRPTDPTRRWTHAPVALVGLAAFGPLAFVEPVQTSLNLGFADVGYWALVASGCAALVGLLLGLGYGLGLRRLPAGRPVAALTVLAVLGGTLSGYVVAGHPGLYGDRLFVVLKARADLSGVAGIADTAQRRREVYRRLVATADASQAPLRRKLSALHLSYRPYYLVNGVEVDGGPAVRAWLSTRSDVDRVLLNPRMRPLPAPAGPMTGDTRVDGRPEWNITMIGADQVWAAGDTGRGVVIGTSDSGVDATHPALAGSFRGGDDSWYDPWNATRTPTDHNGHGTHTIATALGRNGVGVAPGAQWMGCVNLDRNMGNPGYYLDCLQFMLAPFPPGGDPLRDGRPDRAADVLTNSWACPPAEGCDARSLRPAIDALTAAGVFVVAAAGNTGPYCDGLTDPPAIYPDTFTVGAVDRTGTVTDFSSRGPNGKPDLVAPGQDVVSALPGGGYGPLLGTSMATPHVAGVVALMWSANPRLVGDIGDTARILRQTATPVRGGDPRCGTGAGAGIVNAVAAVRAARSFGA